MENIGILPNHWNGPIKQEHRSEQRHAWSTHQEHLSQHDALASDLETVSIWHAESIDIDKALQEKIKALRVHSQHDISSKQEIKTIQKEIEIKKKKRHALKIERAGIKKTMQELKDSGLNSSRINGRRPTSSTPAPTGDKLNPLPHSDIKNPLPLLVVPTGNVNHSEHLEVASEFTLLHFSIFKILPKSAFLIIF